MQIYKTKLENHQAIPRSGERAICNLSGDLNPSEADIQVIRKLKKAGVMLDLPVLDHLIVSSEGFYSIANEGLL